MKFSLSVTLLSILLDRHFFIISSHSSNFELEFFDFPLTFLSSSSRRFG